MSEAARTNGRNCAHSAYKDLGCRVKCGQCLPYARQVVESALAAG